MREQVKDAGLSAEEEVRVAARAKAGDLAARETILRANRSLLKRTAARFKSRGLPVDDLVQEGAIALLQALDGFDPARGTRFGAFAAQRVEGSMKRAIAQQVRIISVPVAKASQLARVFRAIDELRARLGRYPTIEELADETSIDRDDVLLLQRVGQEVASLHRVRAADRAGPGEQSAALDSEATYSPGMVQALLEAYPTLRSRADDGVRGLLECVLDLEAALLLLPEEEYEAVDYLAFQGYSIREAGERSGVHFNTLRHRYRKAIGRMTAALNEGAAGVARCELRWRHKLEPILSLREAIARRDEECARYLETVADDPEALALFAQYQVIWQKVDDGWMAIETLDPEKTAALHGWTLDPLPPGTRQ